MPHGASIQDWNHFSQTLGLQADLLPVVSNPNAVISAGSKMASCGKTPSVYNRVREVCGFTGWTAHSATQQDVDSWQKEPDYGICIQTRRVRAIDVDVTDPEEAAKIAETLAPLGLPMRFRGNSSKFLLVFQLEGEYPKRSFKTPHGIIEFLGNGQQFIACGTHPSGARYEWKGGLPASIPTLDEADILDLFGAPA